MLVTDCGVRAALFWPPACCFLTLSSRKDPRVTPGGELPEALLGLPAEVSSFPLGRPRLPCLLPFLLPCLLPCLLLGLPDLLGLGLLDLLGLGLLRPGVPIPMGPSLLPVPGGRPPGLEILPLPLRWLLVVLLLLPLLALLLPCEKGLCLPLLSRNESSFSCLNLGDPLRGILGGGTCERMSGSSRVFAWRTATL